MVIRNPYRAVLSYWNYKTMKSHTKTNTADSLKSAKFQQFAKTGIQRWLEVITDWLEYSNELYCIFYEVFLIKMILTAFAKKIFLGSQRCSNIRDEKVVTILEVSSD